MSRARFEEVAEGVYCIDAQLYREGLAACYLVREGQRLAALDTGTAHSTPLMLQVIEALGLTPAHLDYVMPTHVHLDHAGGAGSLMAACPNAQLIVHRQGAAHLIDPTKLIAGATQVYGEADFARDYGTLIPVPESRVRIAEEDQRIDLNGRSLTFIDTPGHANHHGCFFDAKTGGCFTGDTFGIAYREFHTDRGPWLIAPTTPVAFDPEAWLQSLDRLMALAPQRMYLTHYGAVEHPERLVDALKTSIQEMAEVALAEEGQADAERQGRIKAGVTARLLASARAHGVVLPESDILALLALDRELNAQGLEVWLRRRAKRAAAATGAS